MRQSQLFSKTRHQSPKDETSRNAELLIRAGFIHKEMAGVYAYLPLGLKVLRKIENIIREEMNAIGGQELLLTALQEKEIWEKTNRWDDKLVDNWFKTHLKNKSELGLATTHEEPLTRMMKDHIRSYRDLPTYLYQFQTKFRNELRSKSGMMRGREFIMKDLYSFSRSTKEHQVFYERIKEAYTRIFERVGLGEQTFVTFASGGSFSKFSHEFQTLTEAGEDTIYLSRDKKIAVNKEVYTKEILQELGLSESELTQEKAVEVGNIFSLGTRFSEPLGLNFLDENGNQLSAVMGSYGIGLGRVLGTVVEVFSDTKGIIWPKSIAPFQAHLICLGLDDSVKKETDKIYQNLLKAGIEVFYDDRTVQAGEKLGDADLLGIPLRILVSAQTMKKNKLETKKRSSTKVEFMGISDVIKCISEKKS